MKILSSTGPLAYRFDISPQSMPDLPPGRVRIHLVRYETIEMTREQFETCRFQIHDAARPEPREIARHVIASGHVIASHDTDRG